MHLLSACQTLSSKPNPSTRSCKPSFLQKNKKSKIFYSRLRSINSHLLIELFSTLDLDRKISSLCTDESMTMTQMITIYLRWPLLVAIIVITVFKLLILALEQMVLILEVLKVRIIQSLMSSLAALSASALFRMLLCVLTAPSFPATIA